MSISRVVVTGLGEFTVSLSNDGKPCREQVMITDTQGKVVTSLAITNRVKNLFIYDALMGVNRS